MKRLVLILLVFVGGCLNGEAEQFQVRDGNSTVRIDYNQTPDTARNIPPSDERKEFALSGLGVSFDRWQGATAGDFIFDEAVLFEDDYIKNNKVFLEFGVREHVKNNPDQNIEYWYFLKPGTEVRAIVEGTISISFIEHSQDWAVHMHPEGSQYIVSFEHLQNLQVEEGDVVKPGDVLGEAVPWSANDKVGFTELAVWQGGSAIYKYCPFDFLDEDLKPIYEQKITQLTEDWEEFIDEDVYSQDSWVSPGCVVERIKEV
ncbi:MAG: peptidoglycan DD-metalloendopeptidase family protein [Candidatus Aenigmarchaeota archaeon]|nr:peptidoglycan DD-metalloendopeptidase family protein [Candidatus Aenigmarchaeota archaeon]